MSNLILPDFVGMAMDRKRNPQFATRIKATVSGKEHHQRFSAYPVWHFTVPIDYLVNDLERSELDQLMGFIVAHGGQEGSWLYDCPRYNAVDMMSLGVGNGVNTQYQLRVVESHYGFVEPINNPKADGQIYVDGVLIDNSVIPPVYSISPTGLLTFDTAPLAGQAIHWTGGYYHRCRFDTELPDFTESHTGVFDAPDFSFMGSVVNKL
jgi:hypothetical protein